MEKPATGFSRAILANQPVYGLRHQGEDGKRMRYTTVETIASHYASEIRQVQPRGPYLLGGYCFGELVAFEIANQFSQQDDEIRMLFGWTRTTEVFARVAESPTAAKPTMESSPQRWWSRHLRSLSSLGTPAEKLDYCRTRLNGVVKLICALVATPFVKLAKKITIEACLKLGYKIPVAFRSSYILAIYGRAVEKYRPAIHRGRLDIVMSAEGGRRFPELVAVSRRRRGNLRRSWRSSQRPQGTLSKALGRQIEDSLERIMVHRA